MTKTAAPAPRYTVGQSVEVLVHDFATAGMPLVWAPATVARVVPADRLFDVTVTLANGSIKVERVGVRGGNARLRAA